MAERSRPIAEFFKQPAPRLALAALVGTLVFLLPVMNAQASTEGAGIFLVLRGVLAGLAVGIIVADRELYLWAGLSAAVAVGLGTSGLDSWIRRGQPLEWALGAGIVAVALGIGGAWLFAREWRQLGGLIGLGVVLYSFAFVLGVVPGPFQVPKANLDSVVLNKSYGAKQYAFDGWDFLRTRELLQEGQPYYAAFKQAVEEDYRHKAGYLTGPFNFREPALFYIWSWAPGFGAGPVWNLYGLLAAIAMVFGYLLVNRFTSPAVALLAPIALSNFVYHQMWSASPWFALIEPWAGLVAVAAVWALLTRRWVLSAVLLVLAVSFREFMVLLLPAWWLAWLLFPRRREGASGALLAAGGSALVLGPHLLAANAAASHQAGPGLGIGAWLNGGFDRLLRALQFLLLPVLGPAAAALSYVGAAALRPRWRLFAGIAVVLVPMIFLTVFSGGFWEDIWGAFLQPLTLVMWPLAFVWALPRDDFALLPPGGTEGVTRVIVAVRDEADRVAGRLDELIDTVQADGAEAQVLVVDCGSTDGTADVVAEKFGGAVRIGRFKDATTPAEALARGLARSLKNAKSGDRILTLTLADDAETVARLSSALDDGFAVAVGGRPGWETVTSLGHLKSTVLAWLAPVEGVGDALAPARAYRADALKAGMKAPSTPSQRALHAHRLLGAAAKVGPAVQVRAARPATAETPTFTQVMETVVWSWADALQHG